MADIRHYNTCIIGGGASALILGYLLKRQNESVKVIGGNKYGNLNPILVDNEMINLFPIYPAKTSNLSTALFSNSILSSQILNIIKPASNKNSSRFLKKNTLAHDLHLYFDDSSVSIAYKTFGKQIFYTSLPLVIDKAQRHYGFGYNKIERIGFIEGLSPYFHFIGDIDENLFLKQEIESIDLENKIINFTSERTEKISYSKIISTIDLKTLLSLCKIDCNFKLIFTDAKFICYKSSILLLPNLLIYDYDISTPIIRFFTPNQNIVVAQVSPHMPIDEKFIKIRIERLLGKEEILEQKETYDIPKCYPTNILNINDFNLQKNKLETNQVFTFGRNGKFEYKDLHELNWAEFLKKDDAIKNKEIKEEYEFNELNRIYN